MSEIEKLNNGQHVSESTIFNKYNIWNTWIVSDTHFSHYPKTWEWPARKEGWEQNIFNKWNSRIDEEEIVLHLGDFAFGSKKEVHETRKKLNGKIYLVQGNHDRHGIKWYKDIDIDLIKKPFYIRTAGENYMFSHRPLPDMKDFINFHGHIHEKFYFVKENYVNASMEQMDFTPIRFVDLIRKYRLLSLTNDI